jgi:hypothetical protein
MGAEESTIKGPPSLQVTATLNLFWQLNYNDQMHFSEILESRESQLRMLHQYHQVDIPLPIWNLFAEEDMVWKYSQCSIDRWKTLWPHFKGVSINHKKGLVFCTTKELVNLDPGDKTIVEIIEEMARLAHKMPWKIMVEYNEYVTLLEKFLKDGPPDPENRYDKAQSFDHWLNKGKPEPEPEQIPDDNSSEEADDRLVQLQQLGIRMDDAFGEMDDILQEEMERNVDVWVEPEDSESSAEPVPDLLSEYAQQRLDRWNTMMEELGKKLNE